MPGITIVGLGPGDPGKITREGWQALASARTIWLRTREHPAVASLPASARIESFDLLYEHGATFEEVYRGIARRILELGRSDQGVVYAVPGHPFVAEATVPEITRRAGDEGLPLRVIDGVSFLSAAFSALGIDPYPRISLCDALTLGAAHVPLFPPDVPAIIAQIYSRLIASEVKVVISQVFPDEHPVRLVHAAGTREQLVEDVPLYLIDRSEHVGGLTCLYVPPLKQGSSFEALQEVVAHLRAPEGCPWDREQTHASLRAHLLEESYEAISAMDLADFAGMREEFGDLLLQIMLNAQIASEEGEFTVNDVIRGIHDKLVRRHPHVFGTVDIGDVDGVLANWEKLKEEERAVKTDEAGLLGGVPASLPALAQAQEYQDRAARVGFDWHEVHGVLEKIAEEVREVEQAKNDKDLVAELGDVFFALVNFARWKGADAESALREANSRFRRRFEFIERTARQQGLRLSELTLERMDAIWQEAKEAEAGNGLS